MKKREADQKLIHSENRVVKGTDKREKSEELETIWYEDRKK